jgi:peptidoglycan/LPS O-acetylase OafA/YrhL
MTLRSVADFFSFFAALAFPGQAAVLLFFVISGFVLGIRLPRNPLQAAIEWPGFALRRAFRIFPAMWLSIILGAAVSLALHREVSFSALFENATFWSHSLNAPLWTLRIELFLSVLLPPLVVISAPRGVIGLGINIALQAVFWWRTATHDPTLQFAAFFHLGLLVPTVGKSLIAWLATRRILSFILWTGAVIAFCTPFAYSLYFWPGLYTEQLFATALPSFLFVSYAAFGTGRIRTTLNTAAARSSDAYPIASTFCTSQS